MKLKTTIFALIALVLAVTAAGAVAAPGKGKGKPDPTGEACKPRVQVIMKGTLGSAGSDSVTMTVLRANKHGKRFVGADPIQISVAEKAKVRRKGKVALADLVAGDSLMIHARACKADLKAEGAPALVARVVKAWPAKPAAGEEEQQEEETTTPPPPPAP